MVGPGPAGLGVTEPVVSYPLRVVLDRIEGDLRTMREDVSSLKTGSALATARRALWVAAVSPVLSAALAFWLSRH